MAAPQTRTNADDARAAIHAVPSVNATLPAPLGQHLRDSAQKVLVVQTRDRLTNAAHNSPSRAPFRPFFAHMRERGRATGRRDEQQIRALLAEVSPLIVIEC